MECARCVRARYAGASVVQLSQNRFTDSRRDLGLPHCFQEWTHIYHRTPPPRPLGGRYASAPENIALPVCQCVSERPAVGQLIPHLFKKKKILENLIWIIEVLLY